MADMSCGVVGTQGSRSSRSIGPLGTASRILVGVLLASIGVWYALSGRSAWWQLTLGFLGFPLIVTLAQLGWVSLTKKGATNTGFAADCINCALIVVFLVAWPTRNAILIFLGLSMLLAALRGYAGCESLAVSNWLLRRNDQVGCLFFWPVDAIETRHRPA